jgi:ribonuclease HI
VDGFEGSKSSHLENQSQLSWFSFFVPGQAGVRGNERADRLSETAIIGNGQSKDRADIMNAIREAHR